MPPKLRGRGRGGRGRAGRGRGVAKAKAKGAPKVPPAVPLAGLGGWGAGHGVGAPPPWLGALFGAAVPPPGGFGAPPFPAVPAPRAPAPRPKGKAKAKGPPAVPAFAPQAMAGAGGFFGGGWPPMPGAASFPPMPGLGGMPGYPMLPTPPPAVPPGYAPGSSGEASKIGNWLHVPMLQYAVLPYLQVGNLIEASITDPATPAVPCGTLIVSIVALAHVDNTGIFLECDFVGCSSPALSPVLGALFAAPYFGAVLHLCFTPAGCQQVAPNARQHVHTGMVRTRTKTSLSESWIAHGWQAYAIDDAPAAEAADKAAAAKSKLEAVSAKLKAAAASEGSVAEGGEESSGSKASSPKEKELKRKLENLKKRYAEQTVAGGGLFARARKKAKKGDDEIDGEVDTSDFSEAPSLLGGNKIETLALTAPGSLLEAGLSELRRFLAARGGLSDGDVDRLAPIVVQYLRTVYDGAHPPSEQGARNKNEMELIAECIDSLLRGELPHLGDILMQRLKALQVAAKHGWAFAKQLELTNRHDVNLVSPDELAEAARISIQQAKLAESISKAGKGKSN